MAGIKDKKLRLRFFYVQAAIEHELNHLQMHEQQPAFVEPRHRMSLELASIRRRLRDRIVDLERRRTRVAMMYLKAIRSGA